MDLLRRTDNAAHIIQQRVRKRLLGRNEKLLLATVVDDALAKAAEKSGHDDDGDETDETTREGEENDDEEQPTDEEDDEEEKEETNWDRIYSLILVSLFGMGMIIQRCIGCCMGKVKSSDEEDDVEAVVEGIDMMQGTGTELNPVNPFSGTGGGGGGGGTGAAPTTAPAGGGGGGGAP